MPVKTYKPNRLKASSPRTGSGDQATLFRGKNMWIRGGEPQYYAEVFSGNLDLNEQLQTEPITGKVSFTAGSTEIIGESTIFTEELHIGQFVYAGDELLVVDKIISDDIFHCYRPPSSSVTGARCYRLPVLFELDKKRGSLLRGNAQIWDQGTIIAVGDGELYVNGAPLPGTTLVATRKAKCAIYDPVAKTYDVFSLGFADGSVFSGHAIAGGTRGMTAGQRGFRVTRARKQTGGYGNPSENVKITLAANEKVALDFDPMDTANGQNAHIIWVTIFESNTSLTPAEGPWYKYKMVTDDDLGGTGSATYEFEYLNSEIGRSELLSFNNDQPTDAEFVASLVGYPIFVSCQGEGTAAKPNGTSPGPYIVPAKPNNIEAAPLAYPNPVATSPPETIIGFCPATGRLFLMTANRLNIAAFTGNPNFPTTIRPYWNVGFANPYSAVFYKEMLFAATTKGVAAASTDGDNAVEYFDFPTDIEEITRKWNFGHSLSGYDPKNEAICFFYSAAYRNDAGYWVTVILPYLINQKFFNPLIVIESNERDMIVSGVATVSGFLEFTAGGKNSVGGIEARTYRFDCGKDEPVNYYLAWNYTDEGLEDVEKIVKGVRVTGKTTNGIAAIYGAESDDDIDVVSLEDGSLSASGDIAILDKPNTALSAWVNDVLVKNLLLYTVRVGGTWDGTGEKDRIDEVAIRVQPGGKRK